MDKQIHNLQRRGKLDCLPGKIRYCVVDVESQPLIEKDGGIAIYLPVATALALLAAASSAVESGAFRESLARITCCSF